MNSGSKLMLVLALTTVLTACSKPDDKPSTCAAGSGGTATAVLDAKHHGRVVNPIRVYLKYDAVDAPSNLAEYDLSLNVDTAVRLVRIAGLKCGNYYVFMTAYDSAVQSEVKGGFAFPVNVDERGEVPVEVAVTE